MNRRQLLSLSLLSAIPIPEGVRPVRVDRNGNLLDPGSFPKEGVAALQLHLDWLHDEPEYFFHIDFPVQYVGLQPEEWERIIPVDQDLDYRVPVVSDYKVVDPGYKPAVKWKASTIWAAPAGPYLNRSEVAALQDHLVLAREDSQYCIFCNYPIRSTDPHLQSRIYVFDGASDEEIDAQRSAWDRWAVGPMEHRVYA